MQTRRPFHLLCAIVVTTSAVGAQSRRVPSVGVRDTAPRPGAVTPTASRFKALRWRNIGPFRGGRTVAVTGDPTEPRTFYFGAVNGGVWKTTNGGQSWRNLTDEKIDISSVGAIAVAPSDNNVIYVGGGEAQLREDLTYGTGMYRSTDGGESWQHLGLGDTHHIASVRIDPKNPDRVFVAAMGHAFGPNAERGVFRTLDGGKNWQKVLFLNDSTGAIDLVLDPTNPRVLYASLWKFQRTPWSMDAGAGKSGLFKSTDGGDSWTDLSENTGMPARPLGKIGIAVSPSNPRRIFASVEAKDSLGGIFRSDDAGATWSRTSGDQRWRVRAWYYSGVTADPLNENTVWVMNLSPWRSVDGGRTFGRVRSPHGDNHILWIDPADSRRMILGNDGGATISYDAGATWSPQNNQPTSQFYHVITDNQWPYRVYGAQQDNSAITIASRSDYGSIGERDWWSIAGCENATIAVDPRDPAITYGGCYMGLLSRHDNRTKQDRDISVWLANYDGIAAADVPHRFQWTFPVFLSPHDPSTLYVASQNVWRSRNEGQTWEKISPDLTVADPKTLGPSGGPITRDMTGTEWYGTIYTFTESPVTKGVLWAGSDDGLVHLSRDNGATWVNVSPKGMGKFTRMSVIDPSPHDAGTAYIAANRYQQDDFRPYLYRTTDFGATWTAISTGIPTGAYTRTIRADPVRKGLLFAGTESGVYVSMNDGASWEPLQLNLPRSSVRDLRVHGNDVIVATHGRSFWILDDISLIRQLADAALAKKVHLFQPATAVRFAAGGGRSGTEGENPPNGLLVDYWIREKPKGKAVLEFLDGAGKVLRSFNSEEPKKDSSAAKTDTMPLAPNVRRATMREPLAYDPADSVVAVRPGTNRFVWNLRVADAKLVKGIVIDFGRTDGPVIVPGDYRLRLIADGDTLTRPFKVTMDPRLKVTTSELQQLYNVASQVIAKISEVTESVQRIEEIQSQLDARVAQTKEETYAARIADPAKILRARLDSVRHDLAEVESQADQITLHYPIKLYNMLITLNFQVQSAEAQPTDAHRAVYADLGGKVDAQVAKLRALESSALAEFNKLLKELDVPSVMVAPKKAIAM